MRLKSSPMFKKVMEAGESQVGRLAGQLLSNEGFVAAIQGLVSRTLNAKGTLDKSLRAALAGMNLPSTADIDQLQQKLDDLDRMLGALDEKLTRLAAQADKRGGKTSKRSA